MGSSIVKSESIRPFLWGHFKKNINTTTAEDLDTLKIRITEEINIIKKEMLRAFFLETIKRLHFCSVAKSNTFEQYV
jgi:hypothetical protein